MFTKSRVASIAAVMLHVFGIGSSQGLMYPLTTLRLEFLEAPLWVAGLAAAMTPIAFLLFMPTLPAVVTRFGAILSMSIGCGIGCCGLVSLYVFNTEVAIVFSQSIIGVGLAIPWLTRDVWINTVAQD